MEQKTISVIIPARNEQQYLPSCLAAICNEKNYKFIKEIIVIDNCSEDATAAIALEHGCGVLRSSLNSPAALRNLGAKHAKGNFLAFIDADCIIPFDWCYQLLMYFANPAVVAAGFKISPDFDTATWVELSTFYLNNRRGKKVTWRDNVLIVRWLGTSNLLVRAESFCAIGGFDESLVVAEDYDFCNRLNEYGLILLDERLNTVHLRESKTLIELFKRELWRGQNSFSHWKGKGFPFYELPSIIIPLFFTILLFLSIFIAFFNLIFGMCLLGLNVAGVCLIVLKKIGARNVLRWFLPCVVVQSVYLLARGCALILELFRIRSVS